MANSFRTLQYVNNNLGNEMYASALDLKDDPKYYEYMATEFAEYLEEIFDDSADIINAIMEMQILAGYANFYKDGNKTYIQLSDEYIDFGVDTKKLTNEQLNDLNMSTHVYLDDACAKFKDQTGIDVYLLGRSGRHVCVENNFENALKYDDLCTIQKQLKNEYIKDIQEVFNNY